MGRTRVDPSKRRRASQACRPCHASKKRCDSKEPCTNCIKRNDRRSCVYDSERPRVPGNQSPAASKSKVIQSPADTDADGTRMLWNSRGNQVYVGRSATLSFLHILRNILTCYMGHSSFTDDNRRNVMLETDYATRNPEDFHCLHTFTESFELVEIFFAATCGVLDIWSKDQIVEALGQASIDRPSLLDAAIHVIIAIGAQCRSAGPRDGICERYHVSQAQRVVFENMLDDPNIHMIRVFVLLGFYMLGACRRNCAFMYVGVAARAVHVIGLHHEESYRSVPREEQSSFSNTWKSVRLLDLVISSVLGRPTATGQMMTNIATIQAREEGKNDRSHRYLALQASFEAWHFVDQIVQLFYKPEMADLPSAKKLLSEMEVWSSKLPTTLKTYTPTSSMIENQELILGNMHVSCSYYFAVMLVTRKYFVSHQMFRLSQKHNQSKGPLKKDQARPSEYPQMTQACVESAKLMLQTCRDVLDINMLLNNMCLLKAWVFAAALVVGLAMFVDGKIQTDMGDAFEAATAVLHKFSRYSPQAQHYHEILTNFLKAIKDYHQRNAPQSSKEGEKMVEKLFNLNTAKLNGIATVQGNTSSSYNQNQNKMLSREWPSLPVDTELFSPLPQSISLEEIYEGDMDNEAAQLWNDLISQGFPFITSEESGI